MIKEPLVHLPLESYGSRYTEYMATIEKKAFSEVFDVKQILPDVGVAADITTGRVLDRVNRPRFSMAQMSQLLAGPNDIGKIYLSDFYTTGLDSLMYSGKRFAAYSFCWAQTFDRFDFTAQEHMAWMRSWEYMALAIYRRVFVASTLLKELIVAASPASENIVEVVGLPFDSEYIKSLLNPALCPADEYDCVYSSRWDEEKQPLFLIELVKANPNLKFAVCTGRADLTGTELSAIRWAFELEKAGRLTIYRGCTKPQYLAILSRSRVQFNCALQDWVSFTLLEALTMGCQPLYPNFRSFPEALMHAEGNLYSPFNVKSASEKLRSLVKDPTPFEFKDSVLYFHDNALRRIAESILQD
jgi:hypothetical protein